MGVPGWAGARVHAKTLARLASRSALFFLLNKKLTTALQTRPDRLARGARTGAARREGRRVQGRAAARRESMVAVEGGRGREDEERLGKRV